MFAFNQVGAWLAAKSRNQINNLATENRAKSGKRTAFAARCTGLLPPDFHSCATENRRHRHHLVIVIIAMGFPRFVLSAKTLSHKNNNREQRNQKKIRKHKNQIKLPAKATMKREKWNWRWGKWRENVGKCAVGGRGCGAPGENAHDEMGESAMTRAFLQLFFVEKSQLCEKKDKNKNRKINAHTHTHTHIELIKSEAQGRCWGIASFRSRRKPKAIRVLQLQRRKRIRSAGWLEGGQRSGSSAKMGAKRAAESECQIPNARSRILCQYALVFARKCVSAEGRQHAGGHQIVAFGATVDTRGTEIKNNETILSKYK